jgi:hypothetical protein
LIVWLDLSDIESRPPLFKEKIYVKANRLSWSDSKSGPALLVVTGGAKPVGNGARK